MLLKFMSSDMLNSPLVNVQTGQPQYLIISRASYLFGMNNQIIGIGSRTTRITNSQGAILAEIEWDGMDKRILGEIKIMGQRPVHYTELFDGCEKVKILPDTLTVPTRLNSVWVATRNSLELFNSETGAREGRLYEDAGLVDDRIVKAPMPGIGHNFLQFSNQAERVIIELIIDYFMMNIMRRAMFGLPKYDFDPEWTAAIESRQTMLEMFINGRRHSV